jgi:hypothetical protein
MCNTTDICHHPEDKLIVAVPCRGQCYILEETHLSKLQKTVFSTVLSNGKVLHEVLMFISAGKFTRKLCGKMNSNVFRLYVKHMHQERKAMVAVYPLIFYFTNITNYKHRYMYYIT